MAFNFPKLSQLRLLIRNNTILVRFSFCSLSVVTLLILLLILLLLTSIHLIDPLSLPLSFNSYANQSIINTAERSTVSIPDYYELDSTTIFLSIASYRDPSCSLSIKQLYQRASKPKRVFVGIFQQIDSTVAEEDCLYNIDRSTIPMDNIRLTTIDYRVSQGPTVARYYCSLLFAGEDIFAQIDSHMNFRWYWDNIMVEQLNRAIRDTGITSIVLSNYPKDSNNQTHTAIDTILDDDSIVPTFCEGKFNSDNIIQPSGGLISNRNEFYELPFVAAGYMYGPGELLINKFNTINTEVIPFEPYLPQLFHGEELLNSIRYHAAGFRFYSPVKNILLHLYLRQKAHKPWGDLSSEIWYKNQKVSLAVVKDNLLLDTYDTPAPIKPLQTIEYIDPFTNKTETVRQLWPLEPNQVDTYYQKFKFNLIEKSAPRFC